jgi:hypothetical protein
VRSRFARRQAGPTDHGLSSKCASALTADLFHRVFPTTGDMDARRVKNERGFPIPSKRPCDFDVWHWLCQCPNPGRSERRGIDRRYRWSKLDESPSSHPDKPVCAGQTPPNRRSPRRASSSLSRGRAQVTGIERPAHERDPPPALSRSFRTPSHNRRHCCRSSSGNPSSALASRTLTRSVSFNQCSRVALTTARCC